VRANVYAVMTQWLDSYAGGAAGLDALRR